MVSSAAAEESKDDELTEKKLREETLSLSGFAEKVQNLKHSNMFILKSKSQGFIFFLFVN